MLFLKVQYMSLPILMKLLHVQIFEPHIFYLFFICYLMDEHIKVLSFLIYTTQLP